MTNPVILIPDLWKQGLHEFGYQATNWTNKGFQGNKFSRMGYSNLELWREMYFFFALIGSSSIEM
ncbi:MAG: hypothetical protein A2W84_11300 [Bacteroidetes bacterium GWC2_40_13]|nr:MAG: hypothetical protein A2W84_11300 [Bacteroidetes bacterium GWC2_40_13]